MTQLMPRAPLVMRELTDQGTPLTSAAWGLQFVFQDICFPMERSMPTSSELRQVTLSEDDGIFKMQPPELVSPDAIRKLARQHLTPAVVDGRTPRFQKVDGLCAGDVTPPRKQAGTDQDLSLIHI